MRDSDRLWAPWRGAYISQARRRRRPCIFCVAARSRNDRHVRVVYRGKKAFILLNNYPYNNGHVMVSPYRHVGSLSRLTADEIAELFDLASRAVETLQTVLHPQGFNLGINLGRAAGAGIPGHLHLHVVPRWVGDTNFMWTIAGTKVISESLDALDARLRPLMARRRTR